MKVVLCGSMSRSADMMQTTKWALEALGIEVLAPPFDRPGEDSEELSRMHWEKIKDSDAVAVLNPEGYVGASTFGEIALARYLDKPVYMLYPPNEKSVGKSELDTWHLKIWGEAPWRN